MNEVELNEKLLKEPDSFWKYFKDCKDFDELLKLAKIIYKERVVIPTDCRGKLNNFLNKCIMEFVSFNVDYQDKVFLVELALEGKRDINNFKNIKSYKQLLYSLRFGDVLPALAGFINRLSVDILKNMNIKHFFEYRDILLSKGCTVEEAIKLDFQIYNILGYFRGKDLLNNKYGEVDIEHLKGLVNQIDLNDITYQEKEPHVNGTIINLLMAENYHVMRTPLEKYLRDENNDADIDFVNNLAKILKNWDLIVREYTKRANMSTLKMRLNISTINEIMEDLKEVKRSIKKSDSLHGAKKRRFLKIPDFKDGDEPLLNSDLFDYIGVSRKYMLKPEKAYDRAVLLSRDMNGKFTKKFPDVTVHSGKYKLFTFHPQDRDILSAGFRTDNCFIPQGTADGFGSDGSLLMYCATSPYGGGIEIRNDKDETLAFSPILRNGNVLMALSIEGVDLTYAEKDVVKTILDAWASEVIKESNSKEENGGIKAVVTASIFNINEGVYKESLPADKKFHIYDIKDSEPSKLYLVNPHRIIALKEGFDVDDITYDIPVNVDYKYETEEYLNNYNIINLSGVELSYIKDMISLEDRIAESVNIRIKMLQTHQDVVAMEMLRQIKEMRGEFLQKYQELLALSNKGKDKYSIYLDALEVIKDIKYPQDYIDLNSLINIYFTDTWFIAEDSNGLWHSAAVGENKQYDVLLNNLGANINRGGR